MIPGKADVPGLQTRVLRCGLGERETGDGRAARVLDQPRFNVKFPEAMAIPKTLMGMKDHLRDQRSAARFQSSTRSSQIRRPLKLPKVTRKASRSLLRMMSMKIPNGGLEDAGKQEGHETKRLRGTQEETKRCGLVNADEEVGAGCSVVLMQRVVGVSGTGEGGPQDQMENRRREGDASRPKRRPVVAIYQTDRMIHSDRIVPIVLLYYQSVHFVSYASILSCMVSRYNCQLVDLEARRRRNGP